MLPGACATMSLSPQELGDRHGYDAAFYRDLLSGRVWVNANDQLNWFSPLEATY